MEMSFAVFFTSIGNAGFKGSSLGASGNFDCGPYGFGRGSPYYRGPPEPEVKITRMELPVPAVVPVYVPIPQPVIQKPVEIEIYKLELREEETSLRMRSEFFFKGFGFEIKESFEYDYNKKTSLLDIIKEKRRA
ncbi:MAG: hypothetical protein PHO02_02850 [Candidatus Nanoarchaeia archaeon]|nr:hypothetical protein [Candidatus Nanoarchaeia archaeon]